MPLSPTLSSTRGRAQLVALLFVVAMISYMDRGSLSIAAPVLIKEMSLSPIDMGVLLSSFFWSYALLQIPGGWLADRFPIGWVLAIGVGLWSLATLFSGLVDSLGLLILMRVLLGAGEAVLFPCISKAIAGAFTQDRRGMPNSIIDAGAKLGPALGVFGGGLIAAYFGWRVLFIVLGCVSLAWVIPWLVWTMRFGLKTVEEKEADRLPGDTGPGFLDILRCRDFWGATVGASTFSYSYYFLLTWLPTYLVNERHLSLQAMAVLGSIPYVGSAITAVIMGWLTDRLIRRGASQTLVRKSAVAGGLFLSIIALPSVMTQDIGTSIWLLSFAYIAFGIFGSNYFAVSQTLAGERATGKWIGMQNAISALTGVAAPVVTGIIIERTGSFQLAFLLTAGMAVIGAGSYAFVIGKIEPIDWSARKRRNAV